jgi:hypothetical protein
VPRSRGDPAPAPVGSAALQTPLASVKKWLRNIRLRFDKDQQARVTARDSWKQQRVALLSGKISVHSLADALTAANGPLEVYERDACIDWLHRMLSNQKHNAKNNAKHNAKNNPKNNPKTAAKKRKARTEQWAKNAGHDAEALMTAEEEKAVVQRLALLIVKQLDQLPPGTKKKPRLVYIGVTGQCVLRVYVCPRAYHSFTVLIPLAGTMLRTSTVASWSRY